jgi:GAF domain-containing protein
MTAEVFSRILQLVCNVFDAYSAVLFLPDQGSQDCRLAASFSLGDDIRQGMTMAPGQGLAGWIIREKKPLLIGNFEQKRGVLGYYTKGSEAEIRAFLGCPLPDVAGALCLDSKKIHSFSDKDQKILSEFAQLVSGLYRELGGLEAKHLDARAGEGFASLAFLPGRHPRWNAYLRELLELVAEVTGFANCFLAVRDEASGTYAIEGSNLPLFPHSLPKASHFPLGGGMIGWVFKNEAPVHSEEGGTTAMRLFGGPAGSQVYGSVICQPVRFSGRTRAVMVVCRQEQVKLPESLKDFTRAAAEQLGLYLENLHLKAKLVRPKA